ncbi:glycosyltransferase family 2 protein [Methylophaga thalassica]|uniref:glycosyltransferase family 2 protein n=1 Tax=Methylophaga thalassica TaxID=40223 RepID=UPI002E7BD44B|nr:glycosyltransferase family 2 protein [Methylophaga thalassica]WVI84745.1 glycosyltransferase family 2 protein [Methylophaga thalassica]
MDIKPLVSVVMPVFNGEKYIRDAVKSILSQTLSDIELIVVNDGSTDNTGNILDEISLTDSRVRVIFHQNKGVSLSRNIAISRANAEFIALMDADDVSEPARLKKQCDFLLSNPEVVALASQVNFICPRGVRLSSSHFNTKHDEIELALLEDDGQHFCQPSVMFRKDKGQEVGLYDVNLKMGEDVDFFLRLALIGKLHTLDECLLNYRRHTSNATASDNISKHDFNLDYLKKAWAMRQRTFPEDFIHWSAYHTPRTRESCFHQWGWNALKKGELSIARKYAIDLLKINPLSVANLKFLMCSIRGY